MGSLFPMENETQGFGHKVKVQILVYIFP